MSVPARSAYQSTHEALTIALRYRRVSSEEQSTEGVSLAAQDSDNLHYIARQSSWVAGDAFQDVLSGRRDDRPDYQRMLLVVRGLALKGQRVVVVVASLDRLGRNVAERVRAYEELKALGASIHSVREGGLVSELTYNILASVAQEESRKLSERISASNREYIANGWHPVGRPAWGYTWRRANAEERAAGAPASVLVIAPDEAPYVREMWTRRANGESGNRLQQWAARLPDAARGGRDLSRQAIRVQFRSPVYIARFDDDRPGRWEPLIDIDTWNAVQRRSELDTRLPAQASGVYPLTGMIRCFNCGGRMAGRLSSQRWAGNHQRIREYTCQSSTYGARSGPSIALASDQPCRKVIPAHRIEPVVLDTVSEMLERLADPGVHARARRAHDARARRQQPDDVGRQIGLLERTLSETRRAIAASSSKFSLGELDRRVYEITRDELMSELERAESELARLRGRPRQSKVAPLPALLAGVAGWAGALRDGAPDAVRDALAVLIETIRPDRVGFGRYEASFTFTPTGRALLEAAVDVAPEPSVNLMSVVNFGKTKLTTRT